MPKWKNAVVFSMFGLALKVDNRFSCMYVRINAACKEWLRLVFLWVELSDSEIARF